MDIVLLSDIAGESSLVLGENNLSDGVEAVAMHDFVRGYDSGSSGGVLGVGAIQLVRHRDKASTDLAVACSTGTMLGKKGDKTYIELYLITEESGARSIRLKYEMDDVFVSRYEYGTVDTKGTAYRRHAGGVTEDLSAMGMVWHAVKKLATAEQGDTSGSVQGGASSGVQFTSKQKAMPTPLYDEYPGGPTDVEIERVWLSPKKVRWTFPGDSDNITGSFDNMAKTAGEWT